MDISCFQEWQEQSRQRRWELYKEAIRQRNEAIRERDKARRILEQVWHAMNDDYGPHFPMREIEAMVGVKRDTNKEEE